MLDVRRLRLLLELERRGTIAAVAEAVHHSPSGVSQQLAQLESESGVVLLERVGRGVRLTDAGRLLAGHAHEVMVRLERAQAELAVFDGKPSGTIRVACFQTAALTLIPAMIERLREYPNLRVEVEQVEPEEALSALLAREFDLIVSEEYPGIPTRVSNEVDRMDVCVDELRLVLPQLGRSRSSILLTDAAQLAWVMEPRGTMAREWAMNVCRSAGFEPDVRFESDDMLVHTEFVRRGQAAAFLPAMLSHGFPTGMPAASLGQSRTIFSLVRKGHEGHPAVIAVRDALMESVPVNRQLH